MRACGSRPLVMTISSPALARSRRTENWGPGFRDLERVEWHGPILEPASVASHVAAISRRYRGVCTTMLVKCNCKRRWRSGARRSRIRRSRMPPWQACPPAWIGERSGFARHDRRAAGAVGGDSACPPRCARYRGVAYIKWRWGWDSNPRSLSARWFSRPELSAAQPPHRGRGFRQPAAIAHRCRDRTPARGGEHTARAEPHERRSPARAGAGLASHRAAGPALKHAVPRV